MEQHADDVYNSSRNQFEKMQVDVWGNIIVMENGFWFFSNHCVHVFRKGNEYFAEFDLSESIPEVNLEIKKCLNNVYPHNRGMSVNISKIMSIIELDS